MLQDMFQVMPNASYETYVKNGTFFQIAKDRHQIRRANQLAEETRNEQLAMAFDEPNLRRSSRAAAARGGAR
jgi:hypothetical protein